ncbi:MAG: sugar phosphate isomerase/epimerase [Planctomycetales bacterium]|nr:sugar phosphate isomerase/epimerase [Planctomycetales bacterium]
MHRRDAIKSAVLAAGALGSGAAAARAAETRPAPIRARYCLNTSTIRGQKLSLVEEIDLAAKTGYDGIEPWMREIDEYVDNGGSLDDLRKRIADSGLTVESAIGFAAWIVDDDEKRRQGLESAKRDMERVRSLGGARIAAPPVGATNEAVDLAAAAERYAKLLEVGRAAGVTPMLELWGFSKSLSRMGEVAHVAIESGQPDAAMLFDVYHIYKGGSDFNGLKVLSGKAIAAFHFNDYPADPPRATIGDADCVYCGDGVAPLTQIIRDLYASGFNGPMSLELFNRTYWQQDAAQVVKTGLEKMKAAVAAAG